MHRIFRFAFVFFFAFGRAAVPIFFPARECKLAFGHAVAKVNFQRNQGKAFLLNLNAQLVDFAAIEQQLARAERAMIPGPAGLIFGYVAIHEPEFPAPGFGVGIAQASLPFTQCLDFRADQNHARFVLVEKFVIVRGGSILSDNLARGSAFLVRGFRRGLHREYDIRRSEGYASSDAQWRQVEGFVAVNA